MAKFCYRHNQIVIRLKGQGKGNKLLVHTIQWHLTSLGPFYIIFSRVLHVYICACSCGYMYLGAETRDQLCMLFLGNSPYSPFEMCPSLTWSSLNRPASEPKALPVFLSPVPRSQATLAIFCCCLFFMWVLMLEYQAHRQLSSLFGS